MLAAAGALVRALVPDDAVPGAARGDVLRRYAALLFHAFRFWRHGRGLWVLEPATARFLVEARLEAREWRLVVPAPAGYLQLPRHLFWATAGEGQAPEAVDGFFWSVAPEAGGDGVERLDLLVVLGMRPGRPGFSSVDVAAHTADVPEGHWAGAEGRPAGDDFANVLPGGELEGLYALTTPMEVLKLASRAFWAIDRHPEATRERPPTPPPSPPVPHAMPPSALPAVHVGLGGDTPSRGAAEGP